MLCMHYLCKAQQSLHCLKTFLITNEYVDINIKKYKHRIQAVRQKLWGVWLCRFISNQEHLNVWHILIADAKLGSRSLQATLEANDISSGYDCTQSFHPQAFSFIFVCVCLCVTAVALPPEKTDSCCVEEKRQERDSQSPAGPQKQLQFEVSVNTEQDVYYLPSGWN